MIQKKIMNEIQKRDKQRDGQKYNTYIDVVRTATLSILQNKITQAPYFIHMYIVSYKCFITPLQIHMLALIRVWEPLEQCRKRYNAMI